MSVQTSPFKRTFSQTLWYRLFRLTGWEGLYIDPGVAKYVIVVWPHTSNWDFPIGFIFSRAYPLPSPHFLGKDSVFRGPLGPVMRWMGGIPIDRSQRGNVVEQVAEVFNQREALAVAVTPEGTRGKTLYWKTGFYYIALAAHVPIVFGIIDYSRKRITYGQSIIPSGDIDADLDRIRAICGDVKGRHPEKQGEIQVRPQEEGSR